jgi:hypothetical protein
MLQENVMSSADCAANVRVINWNNVVMLAPHYVSHAETRYECTLQDKRVVHHGRYLDVEYKDYWFDDKKLQIVGRYEVCNFLVAYHKFIH